MRAFAVLVICFLSIATPANSQVLLPIEEGLLQRDIERHVGLSLSAQVETESKSVPLAVLLSLALPGLGEWYVGKFETGKYFLIADGTLWITYATFESRGDWLRSDSRSFATQHAQANFSGNDDRFAVNIGEYLNVDEYNQARLRNRQFDQLYTDASQAWRWISDEHRRQYRSMRIRSEQMYQNAKFVVAGLVINRLVSAFYAGRAAARAGVRAEAGWRMNAGTDPRDAHGIVLTISTTL